MFALLSLRALWLGAAALPLVLLYVLKTRRRRVRVSSAAMFAAARREASARDPWKKLIPELALLLQLLALAALVVAFARPVSKGGALDADAIVIVLDRSASMGTRVVPGRDDKAPLPTRISRARDQALATLDALGVGAEVAVVAAGRDARVLGALGRPERATRDAIAQVDAGLVEGDLEPALNLARDLLRARSGKRRVIVFTDGALARPPTWVDEENGPALDVRQVDPPKADGSREGNVAIVRVDVRRTGGPGSSEPDRVEVGVVLAAYGNPPEGKGRFVTLRRIDRATALDARQVDFVGATATRASATLSFSPAADGSDELATLAIELSPNDALALDDASQVVVPPPRRMPVLLASLGVGGASWIAKALKADPEVSLTQTTPERLASTPIEPWSLVVASDFCPKSAPGGGDIVVVNPPPGPCAGRAIGAAVSGPALPAITSWSPSDPRLRYVDLDGIRLGRIVPIAPLSKDGAAPDAMAGGAALGPAALVRAEGLAILADASTLDRTITIWGFDPSDGDLARKASFVLLVRDAVDVARARRDRSWAPTARGGAPARVTAAAFAKEVVAKRLAPPDVGAIAARAPVLEGIALLEGVDRPGPYALEGSATIAPLTVSLASETESDIERVVEPVRQRIDNAPAAAKPEGARARRDLRWIIALVAAAFLALDALWLTHKSRRVTARLVRDPMKPGALAQPGGPP
jgi:predicted outer membrane lipoprotein